ncbi:hypothetical protein [Photobacterium nomapromontoriensis]|uniref:hypothetical protein n=1 Tax=Photobacterium nomapromontoriensis TaxID=2910237 RepID=UPI003D122E01
MTEFRNIGHYVSKIISAKVEQNNPFKVVVGYITCDQTTHTGLPISNYSLSIYNGLDSPIGKTPVMEFHDITASNENNNCTLTTSMDLLSGNYTIALSVGENIPRTLCSYIQLNHGDVIGSFNSNLYLESIIETQLGFEINIRFDVLAGIKPVQNGDYIIIYDVTGKAARIGFQEINHDHAEGIQTVYLDSLNAGAQITIGYYCGNYLGACAAKQRIMISQLN